MDDGRRPERHPDLIPRLRQIALGIGIGALADRRLDVIGSVVLAGLLVGYPIGFDQP